MDVIKDLTQFSSEPPFLKSLSPASTGDIPPSPPRLDDERIEVPMPKSHSLPASPSQHLLSATMPHHLHHSITPEVASSCFKENNNKDAINFSSSAKTPEPISVKINAPSGGETQIRPSRAPLSPSTPKNNNNSSHQQFCLRWNNYQTNLTNVFDELLQSESFVDVTLACEGQSIKAHKMVLSACSPYFQSLFYDNPCQHPIVIMRDVGWNELKAIMEFMYKGEINVSQDQINPLLKVAEMLKIRGLAEVNTTDTADDISAMASATLVAGGGDGNRGEGELGATIATRRSPPSPKKPRLHVNTEKLLEVNLSSSALSSREGGRKRSRSPSPATIIEHNHHHHQQQQQQQQQREKQKQMQHEQQQQQQSQHQYQARHQLPPQECPSPSMSSSSVRNPFASPIPPHSSSSSSQASNNHSSSSGGGGGGERGEGGGGRGSSGGGNGSGSGGYPIATPPAAESMSLSALGINHVDEMEIKPEIAEMIREEERAKLIEGAHPWMSGAGSSSVADSYQYQLQSMWQKCWNTNQQSLVQQLRFRERGPLKSWRPESMAEAIFSVLKEGLSLSQAARKYDIPYPTFVLYANRVHNMLGPSLDGGTDPRPKARGRPQRILLGMWPEELIRSVIKAVVFRDYREIKEETVQMYANGGGGGAAAVAHPSQYGMPGTPTNGSSSNGYHNKLGSLPPDGASPLSTMAETLRRQIQMSQQSPSPSLNMYKSPAFLQRSEMEDPMSKRSSAEHHLSNAKMPDNLPDLSALGLMGIPGLNVIPQGRGQHQLSHQQQQQHHQQNSSYSSRELKESMQQHMSNAMSQAAAVAAASRPQLPYGQQRSGNPNSSSNSQQKPTSSSPFSLNYKSKGDPSPYKFPDKRMLEGLTPGIDFEAIANGLLQKSHKASPRFEDFFPGPDVSDLFAANSASEAAAGFPIKDHPIAKIKLEQQHHSSDNHEE
ncbi:protein bric-a-brac 2 [Episyrphus balteatus]|uniref:protein bric-a-brac 2 n=1 Tax=Episyrphus balteatus TaxID=286459 RepID=UPI00248623AF|nr:protein bric-a-brac 2 [Episyrphus balteatus]